REVAAGEGHAPESALELGVGKDARREPDPVQPSSGDRNAVEPRLPEPEVDEAAVAKRAALDDRVVDAGHRLETEGDALEGVRTHLRFVDGERIEVDIEECAVLHQPAT